jgi:hypothetical protein
MSRYILSNEIQDEIRALEYVKSCSSKSISFTKDFKLKVIDNYNNGMRPASIFMQAKFPLQYFPKRFADSSIQNWKRIIKNHGKENSFTKERRGSKSKYNFRNYHNRNALLKTLTKDEKIAFYEAENEMLRFSHKSFTVPQAMIFLQDYRLGRKEK